MSYCKIYKDQSSCNNNVLCKFNKDEEKCNFKGCNNLTDTTNCNKADLCSFYNDKCHNILELDCANISDHNKCTQNPQCQFSKDKCISYTNNPIFIKDLHYLFIILGIIFIILFIHFTNNEDNMFIQNNKYYIVLGLILICYYIYSPEKAYQLIEEFHNKYYFAFIVLLLLIIPFRKEIINIDIEAKNIILIIVAIVCLSLFIVNFNKISKLKYYGIYYLIIIIILFIIMSLFNINKINIKFENNINYFIIFILGILIFKLIQKFRNYNNIPNQLTCEEATNKNECLNNTISNPIPCSSYKKQDECNNIEYCNFNKSCTAHYQPTCYYNDITKKCYSSYKIK